MGISKAMMEHVITANARVAAERGGTVICCTRYGNVMCSRGSVIPLFIDQIHAGNPITITNPDMTRFLMNLDEAVDLVKFAFEHAEPGDGLIQERKLGIDLETGRPYEPIEFEVSGDKIQAVHMLPGYTHNIINLSDTENLVTLMWANELFDPEKPDTFYEPV